MKIIRGSLFRSIQEVEFPRATVAEKETFFGAATAFDSATIFTHASLGNIHCFSAFITLNVHNCSSLSLSGDREGLLTESFDFIRGSGKIGGKLDFREEKLNFRFATKSGVRTEIRQKSKRNPKLVERNGLFVKNKFGVIRRVRIEE